jgi:tetratricopeptide (TPR) repeat protein
MLQSAAKGCAVSSLKVICPKCFKGQQVVGDIPPTGHDHVCVFCKTTFRVRPPAHPSSPDLPISRDLAAKPNDLPAAREAVPKPGDLPVSRDAAPKPGDLPVPREAIPKPGDLPVSRDAAPKPGDLPVPREAIPKPGDLPVSRDVVPKPGDLPVPRDAMPRPGDLPVHRDAMPKPGDLPVHRDAMPRPGDLPVDRPPMPGPPAAMAAAPTPTVPVAPPERSKTPPLGLALDLSFIPPPPDAGAPLSFELPPLSAQPAPAFEPPPAPVPKPAADKKPVGPANKPPPLPRASGTTPPPVPTGGRGGTMPLPPAGAPKPPAPTLAPLTPSQPDAAPSASLLESLELDLGVPPAPLPSRASGADASPRKSAKPALDLGFSLELEGKGGAPSASPAAIPFPGARVANEGMAEAAAAVGDELPSLAPPTSRGASAARALRPVAKRARIPRWIFFAAGGVAALALVVVLGLPMLRTAPNPDVVLKPMAAELAKDNLPTYQRAADQLIAAAGDLKDSGAKLRLRAAELLLVAQTVHGGNAADLAKIDPLTEGAAGQPKLAPALGRVRALVAIAKGKPRDADGLLADRAVPEAQLIVGIARLAEDKPAAAVDALRKYLAARNNDVVAHYLLGKALLGLASPDARTEFEAVLAQNPRHLGAKVGLARLEETPEKRLAAGRELLEQKLTGAGSVEQAELQLLIGQAAQALGRTAEAMDAYQRAITLNRLLIPASLALGECLLYEGKYKEALERLRAAGPALEATASGKFSLGGAQIANGRIDEGLALVAAAAKEKPDDPRGPFWQGFAASQKKPVDATATEQGFRDAIKRDPKFLPASLKLAAFLQQQDKAEDSLAVLRTAEEAGAPPSVLQLAWGEALIVAKEPAKAQAVFEKALEADPKSMAARLGIASALEAQNKLAEAKASLENTLKESPTTLGLRERLAQVALKLGDKAEALSRYQEEIKAGRATIALRLALAGLAIDLGKIELAQSEAKLVFDEAPRNADAAYVMARVHEAHGEAGAALTEYRHATSWGNTPQFSLSYARLLDKLGKVNEALAMYANAVSLPEGRMERGRISFRAGDLESALADFQAASKMKPSDAEPLVFQGLCLDKMGQSAKAEEAWRAAIKVDGDCPEPHYRLGRMEMDRAKPSAAIEHFRKAAAKAPADSPWRADLTFQLAQAELLTGSKAAALAEFKKYLEIAPTNAPARPEATEQVARLGGGPKKKLGQSP